MAINVPLRHLMVGAMEGTLTEREISELARILRILAIHHLERKHLTHSGIVRMTGLSTGDIALDCLADVFRRDANGKFLDFNQFFHSRQVDLQTISEELLLSHIREFVFRKLNDSIFRIYNEIDPATGKILRNLKLAIEKSPTLRITERFGDFHVVPADGVINAHLPQLTLEELEGQLAQVINHDGRIPGVLERFGAWLVNQEQYQKSVRMGSLAVAIRNAFEMTLGPEHNTAESPDDALVFNDTLIAIRRVCRELIREFTPRYVGKGRIDPEHFAGYARAIEGVLMTDFLDEGTPLSYFDHLKKENPGLTREEYHAHHRTIFEYLVKLGKERTRAVLRGT